MTKSHIWGAWKGSGKGKEVWKRLKPQFGGLKRVWKAQKKPYLGGLARGLEETKVPKHHLGVWKRGLV